MTSGGLRARARGAGSELLLALDMRFASRERGVLGQPEVAAGLLPGAAHIKALVDSISAADGAMERDLGTLLACYPQMPEPLN